MLASIDPGDGLPVALAAGDEPEAREVVVRMLQRSQVAAVSVGGLERSADLDALAGLQADPYA